MFASFHLVLVWSLNICFRRFSFRVTFCCLIVAESLRAAATWHVFLQGFYGIFHGIVTFYQEVQCIDRKPPNLHGRHRGAPPGRPTAKPSIYRPHYSDGSTVRSQDFLENIFLVSAWSCWNDDGDDDDGLDFTGKTVFLSAVYFYWSHFRWTGHTPASWFTFPFCQSLVLLAALQPHWSDWSDFFFFFLHLSS